MKTHLLFLKVFVFLLTLSFNTKVFSQFKQIYLGKDDNVYIRKIDFYNASEGYIAFSRSLGFTTDSGKTIIDKPIDYKNVNFNGYAVNLTFGFEISGVKVFDRNKLLVYGNYGLVPAILYSNDGANSFKVVFHSQFSQVPDSYISDLAFEPNNKVGYALERYRILKTTDGGQTWAACYTKENNLTKIRVFDESTIYVHRPGISLKFRLSSTDGGVTWENIFYNYADGYSDGEACQSYLSDKKIWFNSNNGKLLTSEDGGKTWALQNDPINTPVVFSDIKIINDSTAYAIPEGGFDIYKTSNKGKLWEKLHRSNSFSYLNYGLESIQILNSNIWVGGGHGYLALSNNMGGTTIPRPIFSLTQQISESTSTVKIILKNYGNVSYNYQWYVNGKKISNTYDATYTADLYGYNDTIKLVANNSLYADTLVKTTSFSRAVNIISFSPSTAATGQNVNIYGINFKNITEISFGGVPAESFYYHYGNLVAKVGKGGGSGAVKVSTSKSTSSKLGFIYIPPPKITSISSQIAKIADTIIIKGERLDKIDNVWFNNNTVAKFKIVSENELKVVVPSSKNPNGNIIIESFSGSDTISGFKLQPQITKISASKGRYNSELYIYGSGFYDVDSITLDGYPASIISSSGDVILIKLGEGGEKGEFDIKLKNKLNVKYTGFDYYQIPKIKTIIPAIAKPGDQIIINGDNFRQKSEENFVYFGAVRATINSATKTSLSVTVPIGATYSTVTVVNAFTTSTSVKYFTPVFEKKFKINSSTFNSRSAAWMGNNINSLSIGDFNGDGKLDITSTEYGSAGTIYNMYTNNNISGNIDINNINNVKSSFSADNSYQNGSVHSTVVDWNYDGVLDVVLAGLVGDSDRYASYFKSNYIRNQYRIFHDQIVSLGYRASFFHNNRYIPTGIVANDMNVDGQTDILMSGQYNQSYFPNIHLGDLDGDEKPDVLVKSDDSLLVYKNTSTKDMISYAPKQSFYVGATIEKLVVAHFDNDEKLDIALAVSNSTGIQIWKNTSSIGNISLIKSLVIPINATPTTIAVADISGDGKIDLAVGHDKGKVLVYQNNTNSNIEFLDPVLVAISAINDLALADIDGDTRTDIVGLTDNIGDLGLQIMRNAIGTSTIASFYPTGGPSGTTVEIKGKNFNKTQKLNIGGIPVASYQIKSDTTIIAIVGQGNYGFISLESTDGAGSSSSPFNFLYKPQIASHYNTLGESIVIKPGDSVSLSIYNYKREALIDPLLKIQWFKDGKLIPNATKNHYIAKDNGNYTVQTSYNTAKSLLSESYQVRVLLAIHQNNFQISVNNIACKGLKTGSINIKAIENLDYLVTLSGPVNSSQNFSSETTIKNLSAGSYKMKITINGQPSYEQLYEIIITEPENLIVFSTVNSQEKTINFKLEGSDIYYISINDKTYTAFGDTKLSLADDVNKISITTDKICQGRFEEVVNLNDYILIYPNPFKDILRINTKTFIKEEVLTYKISTLNGAVISSNTIVLNNTTVKEIDLTYLPQGIYLLNLISKQKESIYKIIKL